MSAMDCSPCAHMKVGDRCGQLFARRQRRILAIATRVGIFATSAPASRNERSSPSRCGALLDIGVNRPRTWLALDLDDARLAIQPRTHELEALRVAEAADALELREDRPRRLVVVVARERGAKAERRGLRSADRTGLA